MNNLGATMSDDREFKKDWNTTFSESKDAYRKKRTQDDKDMIEKFSLSVKKVFVGTSKEKWTILFLTKYGERGCVFYPESGKWHKLRGQAKGQGAMTMFNYFNPTQPK